MIRRFIRNFGLKSDLSAPNLVLMGCVYLLSVFFAFDIASEKPLSNIFTTAFAIFLLMSPLVCFGISLVTYLIKFLSSKKGLFFLFITFLFLPLSAEAVYETYTYGSGDLVVRTLTTLSSLIYSGGGISGALKTLILIVAIGGLLGSSMYLLFQGLNANSSGGYLSANPFTMMIRPILLVAVAYSVFLVPRTSVLVIDKVDPSKNAVVSDVPYLLGVTFSFGSYFGEYLADIIDVNMLDVDAIRMRNSGLAIGSVVLSDLMNLYPPGATTNAMSINTIISEYYQRCVFPELSTIKGSDSQQGYALKVLHTSTNYIWDLPTVGLFSDPNVSFNTWYESNDPINCMNAIQKSNSVWSNSDVLNSWITNEFSKNIPVGVLSLKDPPIGGINTEVVNRVGYIVSRYFGEIYGDPQTALKQIAMLNAFKHAYLAWDQSLGYSSGNQSTKIANIKVTSGWIESAKMLGEILPMVRAILEIVVYLSLFFVPIVFVAASSLGGNGLGAAFKILKLVFWLNLWVPLYAILNVVADYSLMHQLVQTYKNTGINLDNFEQTHMLANKVLGYMGVTAWSIPVISYGIVKGGEYALSSAVGNISSGSGAPSTAQQVGGEVGGVGNITVGSTSFNALERNVIAGRSSFQGGADAAKLAMMREFYGSLSGGAASIGGSQAFDSIINAESVKKAISSEGGVKPAINGLSNFEWAKKVLGIGEGKVLSDYSPDDIKKMGKGSAVLRYAGSVGLVSFVNEHFGGDLKKAMSFLGGLEGGNFEKSHRQLGQSFMDYKPDDILQTMKQRALINPEYTVSDSNIDRVKSQAIGQPNVSKVSTPGGDMSLTLMKNNEGRLEAIAHQTPGASAIDTYNRAHTHTKEGGSSRLVEGSSERGRQHTLGDNFKELLGNQWSATNTKGDESSQGLLLKEGMDYTKGYSDVLKNSVGSSAQASLGLSAGAGGIGGRASIGGNISIHSDTSRIGSNEDRLKMSNEVDKTDSLSSFNRNAEENRTILGKDFVKTNEFNSFLRGSSRSASSTSYSDKGAVSESQSFSGNRDVVLSAINNLANIIGNYKPQEAHFVKAQESIREHLLAGNFDYVFQAANMNDSGIQQKVEQIMSGAQHRTRGAGEINVGKPDVLNTTPQLTDPRDTGLTQQIRNRDNTYTKKREEVRKTMSTNRIPLKK